MTSGAVGTTPSYATPAALATMQTLHGIPTYSAAHWSDGDRVALLSDTGTLHWVQVDGNASGTVARTGDPNKATEPSFSHDGKNVVYASATAIIDGRLDTGPADLFAVPYQNRAGGTAKPLPGASEPNFTEYYPAFSPDDNFVAFTRVPGAESAYSNPHAEVYLLPFNGGVGGTAHPPGGQRRGRLPDGDGQPRAHQRLAQVVAAADHRRRQDLLLADLFVEAGRHGQRPALHHRRGGRRGRADQHLPGAVSVESAVERGQPHAVLGRLRDPSDRLTGRAPRRPRPGGLGRYRFSPKPSPNRT